MKALTGVLLAIGLLLTVHGACAADDSDRPPGVEARNWISITERLGFVVLNERKEFPLALPAGTLLVAPENVSAEHAAPRKGYFVVKTDAGWLRLTVTEPSDLAG